MADRRKVAVVTGAGSGIGRAVTLALVAAGWSVALAGRRAEALGRVAEEAGAADRVLAVPTDVSDPAAVAALFAAVGERFGRLDLLFNNAGSGLGRGPTEDLAFEVWQEILGANLTGSFLCIQQAIRMMKVQVPRGGRIINNGSISAHAPRPDSIGYTATKHAITGLTRQVALDGRKHDIACGQIDIGNAETDLARRMARGVPQADGSIRAEPLIDPGRVAEAVVYMASLPLDTNVLFLTVMATKMPFVGRG